MRAFTQLPGDVVVRFLLDVSHDKDLAGRLVQPLDGVEGLRKFFRMDEFA
jgi:hypothetical protein